MKRLAFFIVILIICNFSGYGQLKIVNPTDNAVSLTVGHYVDKGLFTGWNTLGWINIAAKDSSIVLPTINGNTFYLYGRVSGCDQKFEGEYAMFIHPTEAFKIANAATNAPITLNKGIQKAAFLKIEIPENKTHFRYVIPNTNCTVAGKREGKWKILLDRDKEETTNATDITYIREVTYKNNKPIGIVRDYFYSTNILQWDGKLLQTNPDIKHGTCVTYDTNGRKREEANYQNGLLNGDILRWDEDGKEIIKKKSYRTVSVLPPQTGYLFSYFNTGKSRSVVPVKLPHNTVYWYYEFTASRKENEVLAAQNNFKLYSDLTRIVDETGIAKLAMSSLTSPPGGNICNVYLFTDTKQSDLFEAKQGFSYNREGSRTNLTSAIVPIQNEKTNSYLIGLYNPDNNYGIHYAIEVVAIVEETN